MHLIAWIGLAQLFGFALGLLTGYQVASIETVVARSRRRRLFAIAGLLGGYVAVLVLTFLAASLLWPHLALTLVAAGLGSMLYIPLARQQLPDDDAPLDFSVLMRVTLAVGAGMAFLCACCVVLVASGGAA